MNPFLFLVIVTLTLFSSLTYSWITLQNILPISIPDTLIIVIYHLLITLGLLSASFSFFFIFFKIHIIDEFVSYPGRSNRNQMIIDRHLRLTNYASSACWRFANKALYPDHDFRELPPDIKIPLKGISWMILSGGILIIIGVFVQIFAD